MTEPFEPLKSEAFEAAGRAARKETRAMMVWSVRFDRAAEMAKQRRAREKKRERVE